MENTEKCNIERVQREGNPTRKSATRKECKTKKVLLEKSATRNECNKRKK